jgi:hypothetical protein
MFRKSLVNININEMFRKSLSPVKKKGDDDISGGGKTSM